MIQFLSCLLIDIRRRQEDTAKENPHTQTLGYRSGVNSGRGHKFIYSIFFYYSIFAFISNTNFFFNVFDYFLSIHVYLSIHRDLLSLRQKCGIQRIRKVSEGYGWRCWPFTVLRSTALWILFVSGNIRYSLELKRNGMPSDWQLRVLNYK